ncbi:MAG: DMT family transporter [Bilifractor sp.]
MSEKSKAYVGLILVFMIWGSLYVVGSVVLEYLPTFFVMLCRFMIAFPTLCLIVAIRGRKWKDDVDEQGKRTRLDAKGWKFAILLGLLGYAVSVGIQLLGTKYAGSSMASLINALNPVTISVLAVPILGEKLTRNKVIGILLAVFGVYLILGTGGNVNIPGVLLSLGSVVLWSLVSCLTRESLKEYNSLVITRNAVGIAIAGELVFALIEHGVLHPHMSVNLTVVFGLLYLGIVCTGVSYILWNGGLAVLPVSNCSALYPIQPLTSTFLGIVLFHEVVGWNFVTGTICILGGVLLCLLGDQIFRKRGESSR